MGLTYKKRKSSKEEESPSKKAKPSGDVEAKDLVGEFEQGTSFTSTEDHPLLQAVLDAVQKEGARLESSYKGKERIVAKTGLEILQNFLKGAEPLLKHAQKVQKNEQLDQEIARLKGRLAAFEVEKKDWEQIEANLTQYTKLEVDPADYSYESPSTTNSAAQELAKSAQYLCDSLDPSVNSLNYFKKEVNRYILSIIGAIQKESFEPFVGMKDPAKLIRGITD